MAQPKKINLLTKDAVNEFRSTAKTNLDLIESEMSSGTGKIDLHFLYDLINEVQEKAIKATAAINDNNR